MWASLIKLYPRKVLLPRSDLKAAASLRVPPASWMTSEKLHWGQRAPSVGHLLYNFQGRGTWRPLSPQEGGLTGPSERFMWGIDYNCSDLRWQWACSIPRAGSHSRRTKLNRPPGPQSGPESGSTVICTRISRMSLGCTRTWGCSRIKVFLEEFSPQLTFKIQISLKLIGRDCVNCPL